MFSFPLVFALGFAEIDRVDITWNDRPKVPKPRCSHGELYLRVTMSGEGNSRFWATLINNCLPIMDLIDWTRSHPDNTHSLCLAYGIDSGWKYFLNVCISVHYFFDKFGLVLASDHLQELLHVSILIIQIS